MITHAASRKHYYTVLLDRSLRALFYVIGNSLEFPITQKGTNVPMMRTRAKQKHVASDRARRENVPRHILFFAKYLF